MIQQGLRIDLCVAVGQEWSAKVSQFSIAGMQALLFGFGAPFFTEHDRVVDVDVEGSLADTQSIDPALDITACVADLVVDLAIAPVCNFKLI